MVFLAVMRPPTADITVVLVPVACVRTVELVAAEASVREVDEATPTGGGGTDPSALPWSHLLFRFFSFASPSPAEKGEVAKKKQKKMV